MVDSKVAKGVQKVAQNSFTIKRKILTPFHKLPKNVGS